MKVLEEIQEIMETPVENGGVDVNAGNVVQKDSYSPADVAAVFFARNSPKLKKLVSELAPYKLRAALINACTYPLEDNGYNPEDQDEKDFAYLVHEMLLNKTIMQLHFEMTKAEEDMKKQMLTEDQESVTLMKEEVNNGEV